MVRPVKLMEAGDDNLVKNQLPVPIFDACLKRSRACSQIGFKICSSRGCCSRIGASGLMLRELAVSIPASFLIT